MAGTDRIARPLWPLKDQQAAASDPRSHVWLSASAGTGKTEVLSARVFRLLLRGTDPAAILCLTFTKAGAAEMAGRISRRLAAWVRMPEGALKDDLRALGENHHDADLRGFARTLFARVLDAPGGGLRIQTIHGFAQGLLAGFPVEAGLIPGFRPLEAREEAVLARETLAAMLVDAEREGRGRIIDAIGALSRRLGEGEAEKFLRECARKPAAMAALPSGLRPYVRRALDVPGEDVEAWLAAQCADAEFDTAGLEQLAAANRAWGTATGTKDADRIMAWLAGTPEARAAGIGDLISVAFTAKGDPRKYSAKLTDAEPDYAEIALDMGNACGALIAVRARSEYADLLAAGLDAGREYAAAYTLAKRRAGAVDFDDLIQATVGLLEQPGMGDWVRYKLDRATEHILIDEAQDTNADQWRIVRALADEFFATGGAAPQGPMRTLFTVGDYKQAIFGFQGTDPINFAAAERYFSNAAKAAQDAEFEIELPPFNRLSLTRSFRSTLPVLEFVDAALADLPQPGIGTDIDLHATAVSGPGTVTLWTPERGVGDDDSEESWASEPVRALAGSIARRIRRWLDPAAPLWLESKGRPVRPEDIMILVKRRGELASLIVARLYAEGVAVAGVDRLRLNNPLAVRDLLAAVRFVLQPEDDLNLASLLVSPLIGWTQDDLLERAPRKRKSLWRHLRDTRPEEELAALRAMLARADLDTPHRFLERILSGPLDGRRKLLRRLGDEARDPIEELLSAALQFEDGAAPSLQLFLEWFDRGEVEIVRDPSQPRDAVRVMTAHGAKGLQAPLVILADATTDPERSPRSFLAWAAEESASPFPIPRPRAAERSGPLEGLTESAKLRELEEHWRLFYVAATRAEERLEITGALPPGKDVPPSSWYAAAERAFAELGVEGEGERVFTGRSSHLAAAPKASETEDAPAGSRLPDWARLPAPQEARPPRPLAPSSLGEDAVADPPPNPAMRAAAKRGRLLHALFERLPAVAADQRRGAAERWLERSAGVADPAVRQEIAGAACRVVDNPAFAALFGPDALAEAPVAAVVEGGLVVAGTVDRLLVTGERVQVVDFKTGRSVPADLEAIPPYHLKQMAAYVAALRVIFPAHNVSAALLYTAGPRLFELPDTLLEAHKPRFTATEQSLPLGS